MMAPTDNKSSAHCFALRFLCTLSLATNTYATLHRRQLDDYPLALCNDGTQGVYYSSLDSGEGSNFVIFLQGGGYCHTVDSCLSRCEGGDDRCTTSDEPVMNVSGILSDDPFDNPNFHDWFKVHLHYCTSDMHTGNRTASPESGELFFHGKDMVLAMIEDLKENFGLGTGGEVILTGSSAGGAGIVFDCQDVRALLPGSKVSCVPDAAFFYPPIPQFSEDCQPLDEHLDEANGLWNGGLEDFDPFSWWEDFERPLLIGIPMWDTFGMESFYCGSRDNPDHLNEWGIGMMELIDEVSHAHPDIAMFIPGCVAHGMVAKEDYFTEVLVADDDNSYSDAIGFWALEGQSNQVTDVCDPDDVAACNPTCP